MVKFLCRVLSGLCERWIRTGSLGNGVQAGSGEMERKFYGERKMKKKTTKYIHEGKYVAEVEIELLYSNEEWSPYISLEVTLKLDEIRDALQQHNVKLAGKYAKVYRLEPVAG